MHTVQSVSFTIEVYRIVIPALGKPIGQRIVTNTSLLKKKNHFSEMKWIGMAKHEK